MTEVPLSLVLRSTSLRRDRPWPTSRGSTTFVLMAPRSRAQLQPIAAKLSPEVAADVRAGAEAALRGETIALTHEEAEHYYETGELPERVERWAESPDSPSDT